MPPANEIKGDDRLLRQLIYGLAKTQKTWWTLRCAQAGFNVVYLEGDDQGGQIVSQIPEQCRSRIQIIPLAARPDKTVFAPFIATFLRPSASFTWDETAKTTKAFQHDPTHSHYRICPALLTPNDVVVIDGWKALAESSMFSYADLKELDLSEPPTDKRDADFGRNKFSYMGDFLNWVLMRMHALPCHLIVVGHSTVYEKIDQTTQKVIEQREQPISSSGPHAKKLASEFTDVLYFKRISQDTVKIYTGGEKDRDGGSRTFPPNAYDWKDFGPEKFFEKLAWKPTGEPCRGVQWFGPGQEVPVGLAFASGTPQSTTNGAAGTPVAPVIQNEGGGLKARLSSMKGGAS